MKLLIIAALNRKRVIGKNGKIPWHIPEDVQRFKELTASHTVLMGRKTFESIGRSLPQRKNVVISQSLGQLPGVEIFHSLQSAFTSLRNEKKVFIIGGGEIFRQTVDLADEFHLTIVENDDEGDTFFPDIRSKVGRTIALAEKESHSGFTYESYKKIP